MRHERLEPLVVHTGEIEDRVAAVACSHGTQTILVDEGLLRHCIDTVKVILNVLAAVVARDLLTPVAAEARVTATVDSHHDIAVCGHHLVVPAVAPALPERSLRPALAVQQRRVFLRGVKVRRIDDPHLKILAILRLDIALLALPHLYALINMTVYLGDHRELSAGHINFCNLRRACHRLNACNQRIVPELQRPHVVITFGHLRDSTVSQ